MMDWKRTLVIVFLASSSGCALALERRPSGAEFDFGECPGRSEAVFEELSFESFHLTMRDGVRIALDLTRPAQLPEGTRIPAVLTMTRYWRSFEGDGPSDVERFFATRGYAVLTGDSRGTGASFGTWPYHRAPDETRDFGEIADWIVAQPWSNGAVGGFGTSYTANTADWMAQIDHPAIEAIIPRFPDFDPYADLYFPGGIFHVAFGKGWGEAVKEMDLNVPRGNPPRGVLPVDGDDGALVEAAVEARRDVPDVYQGLSQVTFRDDVVDGWGVSMMDWSIHTHVEDLERVGTPMFSWGGWLDAGTAQGVLRRFATLSNPQKAIIGPWSHGGGYHASPYLPPDVETTPSREAQLMESLCYFDRYLKGVDNGTPERLLYYYTIGEEAWKKTDAWPLPGTSRKTLFLAANGALSEEEPGTDEGADTYTVDFDVTTGRTNRWFTQRGGADVVYPDRAEMDARLLVYTGEPLEQDVEVTGTPVVRLHVRSTTEDGAFFVYLEDVDPSGRVTYVTEGQLRALHRRVSEEPPLHETFGPHHSFLARDASPMVPGEVAEIAIGMHPISVLFREGHRIRLAIAGADADTFARIPVDATPTWTVERSREHPSSLELPVVERR